MDDERFKLGHKLTNQYFEEQLVRIRELRESERMFYQKVTDIYSTAVDYDKTFKTTRNFFEKVQNKYSDFRYSDFITLHTGNARYTSFPVLYYRLINHLLCR